MVDPCRVVGHTFSSMTLATPSTSMISTLFFSILDNMKPARVCTVWLKEARAPVTSSTGHLSITM